MSFAAPAWLLLAGIGLVVLLLHVRRRRSVEVSSVVLWRRLQTAARPRRAWKPPRPSLLLLLQLLTVALLALALADPLLGARSGKPDHRIFVVDGSGSMRATDEEPSRHAAAAERLAALLGEWRRDGRGRASVVAATAHPHVVAARYRPRDGAAEAIERLAAGDGPADWERTAELVTGLLAPGERTRVVVLGDGDGVGGDPAATLRAGLPDLPGLDVRTVGFGPGAPNVALAAARAEPLDLEAGRWRLQGELRAFGAETGTVTVRALYRPEGADEPREWASQEVDLEAGRGAFDFDVTVPGAGVLELRLPDDALDHDGTAAFRLSERVRTARALYLGAVPDPGTADVPPLLRALRSVPHVEVDEARSLPADSEGYDLVVLDGVRVPRHPGTHTLWVGAARLEGEPAPDTLDDPEPSGRPDRHPLAAPISWTALAIEEAYRLERRPGAAVLLEASGAPLLQARTTEHGHEVVLAFPPARSRWPRQPGFPAFVASLIRQAVPDVGSALGRGCRVDVPCPLDPRWLAAGARVVGPEGEEVGLPSPFAPPAAGAPTGPAWAPPGFEAPFRPPRAGLYEIDTGTGLHLLTVYGLHPSEGDLTPGAAPAGEALADGSSAGAPAGLTARRALLLLALAVLLLEGWLAGRGPERYLRRAGVARRAPLAGRRRALLALRLATLALLLLALAGVAAPLPARHGDVVLVGDGGVIDPAGRETLERLRASARAQAGGPLGGGRELAAVELGLQPRVAAPDAITLDGAGPVEGAAAGGGAGPGGDLAGALDLAGGLLPRTGGGRIVLASDGNETRGDLAATLPGLLGREIPVDVLPIRHMPDDDTLVEEVAASGRLIAGDSFALHGVVRAGRPGGAVVRLLREGEPVLEREVDLRAGRTVVEIVVAEEAPGGYLYELVVEAEGDPVAANDRAGTLVEVRGPPRLLLLSPEETETAAGELAGALELQGLEAEIVRPDRAPWTLEGWLAYDVVALLDMPAIELHTTQQELLERWVRDHGGGLLLLGGENAFGPGGYYRTPLERVSPLSSRVPREAPEVALLFVLDRSGSMQRLVGEGTRLDVAKEAALSAIDLLHEESLTGVVVFDAEATTLVPMGPVGDATAVREALAPLVPGGGTSIYPALVEALRQMAPVESMARHIVLMTDGLSQPGEFEEILGRITSEGITVSTVAIGDGADAVRLERMAQAAGGAFHETRDFAALPSILSQEALLLSSAPVEERTVEPERAAADVPFLTGLPEPLPPVRGYVLTTAKPEAEVHLTVRGEDGEEVPLLASWRHGAGRVAALATHAAGAWTVAWQALPEYPLLWSQLVRSVLREAGGPGTSLGLERSGDELIVTAEITGAEGEAVRGLEPTAAITPPDGADSALLALREIAPGLYRGSFTAREPGAYRARVEPGGEGEAASAAAYVDYPARYAAVEPDADRLRAIAAATGGRVLSGDEALFGGAAWSWSWAPGWRPWALLAFALFVLELLGRYAPGLLGLGRSPRARAPRPSRGVTGA